MTTPLSDDDFAGNIIAYGGGSRRVTDSTEAEDGLFVSRTPRAPVAQGGSGETKVPDSVPLKVLSHAVKQHLDINRMPSLAATPPERQQNVFQGGWTSGGSHYMDISDRYEPTPEGFEEAEAAARHNEQLAGFDLGSFTELPMWHEDVAPGWGGKGVMSNKPWREFGEENYGISIPRRVEMSTPSGRSFSWEEPRETTPVDRGPLSMDGTPPEPEESESSQKELTPQEVNDLATRMRKVAQTD